MKARLVDAISPASPIAKHDHNDLWAFGMLILLMLFGLLVWFATVSENELQRYKPFLCTAPAEIRSADCYTPAEKRLQELERQLAELKKEKP